MKVRKNNKHNKQIKSIAKTKRTWHLDQDLTEILRELFVLNYKINVKYIIIVQSLKKWHKIVDKIVCVKQDYAYKNYTHIDG